MRTLSQGMMVGTIAAVLLGVTANHVVAQTGGVAGASAALQYASGRIASINTSQRIVQVDPPLTASPAQPLLFTIDEMTMINKDSKPVDLSDLQDGDTISIEYESKDGQNIARAITVQ